MNIRKAIKQDLKSIHNLVRELAIYEKEEAMFTATLEEYERDFEAGIFQCLVAEDKDVIIGMTFYYMAYSTWKGRMMYLEDFVVTESYRRKGVGKLLFDALFEESKKQGAKLVKWQVLDWNEPAIQFYKKENATIETNWYNGKKYLQ